MDITIGDTTISLDRPSMILVPSNSTPGKLYELRVFPGEVRIDTTCPCPARAACVHRRMFAAVAAEQLGWEILGDQVTVHRPLGAASTDDGDPFDGLT